MYRVMLAVNSCIFQSIRCNVCEKVFRDMDLAMYHADKSGHEDFSESSEKIKPLSPEEREKRLQERACLCTNTDEHPVRSLSLIHISEPTRRS